MLKKLAAMQSRYKMTREVYGRSHLILIEDKMNVVQYTLSDQEKAQALFDTLALEEWLDLMALEAWEKDATDQGVLSDPC